MYPDNSVFVLPNLNLNYRGEFEARIWDGTYNPDGSKHRKRLVSKKSSADLERKVSRLKNEVENGSYVQPSDIMFVEYARQWLETKKCAREKNTRAMYKNIIETHLSCLENVRLSDVRNSHFQLAVNRALDKPRACQQIHVTFKQILKMAVADNLIGPGMYETICSDINLPKYARKEKRVLTKAEKDAISKADFTERERAFVYVIYSCGLRRGEALALSKFDFSFQAGACSVSITKSLISHSSYVKMWASIVRKMNRAAGGTDAARTSTTTQNRPRQPTTKTAENIDFSTLPAVLR